jgi:hypothetical protein
MLKEKKNGWMENGINKSTIKTEKVDKIKKMTL